MFWAAFGLIDLDNFELTGIKEFTRFWGLIMFGSFSLINIIVLLNLLIAMMNHSYQLISVSSVSVNLLTFPSLSLVSISLFYVIYFVYKKCFRFVNFKYLGALICLVVSLKEK